MKYSYRKERYLKKKNYYKNGRLNTEPKKIFLFIHMLIIATAFSNAEERTKINEKPQENAHRNITVQVFMS